MISRTSALKKAGSAAQISLGGTRARSKSTVSPSTFKGPRIAPLGNSTKGAPLDFTSPRCPYTSAADAKKQKRDNDRDFLISVLESSATKRDAKAYLQTFGRGTSRTLSKNDPHTGRPAIIRAVEDTPQFVQGKVKRPEEAIDEVPHVAIVKFRRPQSWDDTILSGVARTLTQLRDLGFLSIIVVDCDLETANSANTSWRNVIATQVNRIATTIGRFGTPAAKVVDSAIWKASLGPENSFLNPSRGLFVGFEEAIATPLRYGHIVVVPSLAYSEENTEMEAADANQVVFALTKFLSGLQMSTPTRGPGDTASETEPIRKAMVDRIIVIDPLGGIPSKNSGHGAQVFLNLTDQFEAVQDGLGLQPHNNLPRQQSEPGTAGTGETESAKEKHLANLRLAREALSMLPSTSSVVITSPAEAANLRQEAAQGGLSMLTGPVGTRRTQNPLIHNLLTDRPIYSSSLPIGRIKPASNEQQPAVLRMPTTTLAKRGLPVTVFPNTQINPWSQPRPGGSRLRLTDTCVDLPRLVHLINDSFNRKLDVEHYLARVNDSLAGIIIVGEYEGGAILTWERPSGLDEETAYKTGRLVPYLDKFAVLKKSQGAGGVADIVFNAMVRDCFPYGVCWRSRKDNPVNTWYFERSRGTRKLDNSNWVMFWTTPDASLDEQKIKDYEDVCRHVVPSWEDKKKAAD